MQTRLRMVSLLIVACLLRTCATSAAEGQQVRLDSKPRYIGVASWYGRQHQGRKMANGQRFDRHKLSAACRWFPLGTVIRVVNLENSKSVVVTITDRGPNPRLNRVLDLAEAAAAQLNYLNQGLTPVFFSPVVPPETQHAEIEVHWILPSSSNAASREYGGSPSERAKE